MFSNRTLHGKDFHCLALFFVWCQLGERSCSGVLTSNFTYNIGTSIFQRNLPINATHFALKYSKFLSANLRDGVACKVQSRFDTINAFFIFFRGRLTVIHISFMIWLSYFIVLSFVVICGLQYQEFLISWKTFLCTIPFALNWPGMSSCYTSKVLKWCRTVSRASIESNCFFGANVKVHRTHRGN